MGLSSNEETPMSIDLIRTEFDHARVAQRLRYEPDTGHFYWRKNMARDVLAGDRAGTINKDGELMITLRSTPVPAKHLAWLLHYGHWPEQRITYRSLADATTPEERAAARLDLRIENLVPYTPVLSDNPRSVKARLQRTEQRRARAALEQALRDSPPPDPRYPFVTWAPTRKHYIVQEDPARAARLGILLPRNVLTTTSRDEAHAASDQHSARLDFLFHYQPPAFANMDKNRNGSGLTLQEVVNDIAYNPTTGEFLWRYPRSVAGFRADVPLNPDDERAARFVQFKGQRLYAHMLAWWMTQGTWPGPKRIRHDDRNPANNTIHNLYDIREDDE